MDELPRPPETSQHDADAALTRDDENWFGRQLGEEWRPEEPGIYRFVGRSEDDRAGNDLSATRAPERWWIPWRRH